MVRTTPATSLIATAGVVLLVGLGSRSARVRVGSVAVVATGALLFSGVAASAGVVASASAGIAADQLDTSRTPPPPWWLANGLMTVQQKDGRTYYGAYSRDLVNATIPLRGDELQQWSERELRRQLGQRSAGELVAFEVDKQVFNWGDGMFFAWGEGHDNRASVLLDRSATAQWVQGWNHPSQEGYLARASLTNGVWVFLVLWCGLGLLGAPYRRETLLLALAVLGVAAFALLFQGRSRYLFAYVPVIVVLAATVHPRTALGRVTGRLRS